MDFLAITQPTVAWMLTQAGLVSALHNDLESSLDKLDSLAGGKLAEGPLRWAGSRDRRVVAFWNADYLSGAGDESWGFIRIKAPYGVLEAPSMSNEVFERCVLVANQRLQLLLLPDNMIHKVHDNGVHTCLAGRGSDARQYSIAYVESFGSRAAALRSILCLGPGRDREDLVRHAGRDGESLASLVSAANELISPTKTQRAIDVQLFHETRQLTAVPSHPEVPGLIPEVTVLPSAGTTAAAAAHKTLSWTFDEWTAEDSSLTVTQRRILQSDGILNHPLRIVGPAGSGKTLLMQLLAIRRLRIAESASDNCRVLYIAHNAAMAEKVQDRFRILGAAQFVDEPGQVELNVSTLAEYTRTQLDLEANTIIDPDAHEAKLFQLDQVRDSLSSTLRANWELVVESRLLTQVAQDNELLEVFARLVMAEISTAIKGHSLTDNRRRYVESERPLSRLHKILSRSEREFIFSVFEAYHSSVFETYNVLDSDDLAISLLGRLRTPIWELKRRELGHDYAFVDEAQLFNENERRIFPLLTRGGTPHVPIVLALDEAQEVYGQSTAGFAALGIEKIANESLESTLRSSRSIIELAFFVIQRTTDLFGPEFPDFTKSAATVVRENHPLVAPPAIEHCDDEYRSLGRCVVRKVRALRRENLRQICVVCHAESLWDGIVNEFQKAAPDARIMSKRGERLPGEQPITVVTRPAHVGGQEFDAVICVGLEQGVVPPRVTNSDALAVAVEQQSLREMYVAFTRARYRLYVLLSSDALPTRVIEEARQGGLLVSD